MKSRIKICGLTRSQDVQLAVALGADLLGFIFAESPRRITPEKMLEISAQVPEKVLKVGVFVDAPPAEVKAVATFCNLDVVQLHGSESLDYYQSLNLFKILKVFRLGEGRRLPEISLSHYWAALFDTWLPNQAGGGGKVFDWQMVAPFAGKRFFLAGGLTPENVGRAIAITKPFGVDVSSGVEESAGVKDPAKMRKFVETVRNLENRGGRDECYV